MTLLLLSGILHLGTTDISVVAAVLGIIGWSAASLVSTHRVTIAPHPSLQQPKTSLDIAKCAGEGEVGILLNVHSLPSSAP